MNASFCLSRILCQYRWLVSSPRALKGGLVTWEEGGIVCSSSSQASSPHCRVLHCAVEEGQDKNVADLFFFFLCGIKPRAASWQLLCQR